MWQVIGHREATRFLSRSISMKRLSHAYLLAGPPHVGKLTLALELAQAVNCQAEDDIPCGECVPCRRIADGKHSDVQVLGVVLEERAKSISIDQVRGMQTAASLPPFEGRRKVFIIDRAEDLSHEAANSLLKTLEEPLPHVLIILTTDRESDLLPTIHSRCQRLELRPLPIALTKDVLTTQYAVTEDRAELLARLSGGCLGWALMALQKDGPLEQRNRRLAELVDLVGHATPTRRLGYAAELANVFGSNREEAEDILAVWLNWWRDLLLVKGGNSRLITNLDCERDLLRQAENLTIGQVQEFIRRLQQVRQQLEQNANPRLAFEVLMLNMP